MASVAIGLFIGSLPIYGLHLPLCLAVCVPLRLDAVVAYVAANISNPLVAPFLITGEVEVGSLITTGHLVQFDAEAARRTGVTGFALEAALGSIIVGAALAALGAVVTSLIVRRRRIENDQLLDRAIERTLARYSRAPRGDRIYVKSKLRADPVIVQLFALDEPLGHVVDAGCGRGQIGLFLLELGRVRRLSGWDWDRRKIAIASDAAGEDSAFVTSDFARAEWPSSADTVLVVDVLHYLDRDHQDELLRRAAHALSPGGRLLVRDVDASAAGAGLTMLLERVATAIRYNRAQSLSFVPASEIVARLEALGLECRILPSPAESTLANVLIVAEKKAPQTRSEPVA